MENEHLRAEIILYREDATFMPGDIAQGSVKMVVCRDIEIAETYVSIEGRRFVI